MLRRWLALGLLALLVGGYAAFGRALAAASPFGVLVEFAVAVVVVPLLLWLAFRKPRAKRRAEPAPWRRHEQVVRPLDDPARRALEAPLDEWLANGDLVEDAARIVADAVDGDAAHLQSQFTNARTRRAREAALRRALQGA